MIPTTTSETATLTALLSCLFETIHLRTLIISFFPTKAFDNSRTETSLFWIRCLQNIYYIFYGVSLLQQKFSHKTSSSFRAPILNCNGKYNQGEMIFNFLHPKTFQTKFVPFLISYMEIGKQNLVQNPFSVFKEYENEI